MPQFSVVIPTYNRSREVQRAIESVLRQTLGDFEVLVMDDGSSDDTKDAVARYEDSRVRYVWEENSGGPARPRNRGVALATGEWVCFLDADDWWQPSKLEACASRIGPAVDVLYHDMTIVTDVSTLRVRGSVGSWQVVSPVFEHLLMGGNALATSSVVARRSLLSAVGGFDESRRMIAAEDYNLWLRLAKRTDKFLYVDESLGYYLDNDSGISRKDMSGCTACAIEEFLPALTAQQVGYLNAGICYLEGRHAFLGKDYAKALASLKTVLTVGRLSNRLKAFLMCAVCLLRLRSRAEPA